jgi:hypothetical protein
MPQIIGTVTDGDRYGTSADASSGAPTSQRVPRSTSDNFRVTMSAGQPAVFANYGSPLSPPTVLTDTIDTALTADWIFLWENTPNRYSNGLQIQAGTGITAVYISLSATPMVKSDQAVVNAGGALPSPASANWTEVALTDGYAFVNGEVHGVYVVGAGRITLLSR